MRYTAWVVFSLTCGLAFGQSGAMSAFEVTSVKVHAGPVPPGGGKVTTSGPRLSFECYSILGLIMYAFSVKPYQIVDAAILDHTMYDVLGVANDDHAPTVAEFRILVQSLLADRFKLKAHRETRDTPVYALVVGKTGPKFKQSSPDAEQKRKTTVKGPSYQTSMTKVTMGYLADYLRDNAGLDRPVVNLTDISGDFDIDLTFTPEYRMAGRLDDPNMIPTFAALPEQLGLKLEKRNAPCETLVIDHIDKPSNN